MRANLSVTRSVVCADSLAFLATLPDNSVDSVVTDPPYGISFNGSAWDSPASMRGQITAQDGRRDPFAQGGTHSRGYADNDSRAFGAWTTAWATEALRVLRPGGHLVAFGGSRTFHRLAAGIEDAGFEIRDQLLWVYATGTPKGQNVGKAIDKRAGAVRPVVGKAAHSQPARSGHLGGMTGRGVKGAGVRHVPDVTAPATAAAAEWDGWTTALKPGHEPIVLARKPLAGTVVDNVLQFRTGALNTAGCRIPFASAADRAEAVGKNRHADFGTAPGGNRVYGDYTMVPRTNYDADGRFPSNVLLTDPVLGGHGSRFFMIPKAGRAERAGNDHPTPKPVELMRHLVRLVTPAGGLVLDPFAGSGTTGVAAAAEGMGCLLVEMDPHYAEIAERRLGTATVVALSLTLAA